MKQRWNKQTLFSEACRKDTCKAVLYMAKCRPLLDVSRYLLDGDSCITAILNSDAFSLQAKAPQSCFVFVSDVSSLRDAPAIFFPLFIRPMPIHSLSWSALLRHVFTIAARIRRKNGHASYRCLLLFYLLSLSADTVKTTRNKNIIFKYAFLKFLMIMSTGM